MRFTGRNAFLIILVFLSAVLTMIYIRCDHLQQKVIYESSHTATNEKTANFLRWVRTRPFSRPHPTPSGLLGGFLVHFHSDYAHGRF